MKKLLVIALFVFFIACEKNGNTGIEIRIENSIDSAIDSATLIYDVDSYNFGKIQPREITSYHFYESAVNNPATRFILNGREIMAGALFIDPPFPALGEGRYRLRIFTDTNFYSGYNAEFVKE